MRTALFFGSFNPIHVGHLIIADTIAQQEQFEEVWFIVSPQNPFKQKRDLLAETKRLALLELALEGTKKLKASDIEFELPKPSYTIDTLKIACQQHPARNFSIIMGEDNLKSFHKWKDYKEILNLANLIVYPRPGYKTRRLHNHPAVSKLDVPLLGISSTLIRNRIQEGKSIRYLTPLSVMREIEKEAYYR